MKLTEEDDELYELESLIADLDELMQMASESNQDIRCLDDLKAYKRQILLAKFDNRSREPESGTVQAGPKKEEIKPNKLAQTQDLEDLATHRSKFLETAESKAETVFVSWAAGDENKSMDFLLWQDVIDDNGNEKSSRGVLSSDPPPGRDDLDEVETAESKQLFVETKMLIHGKDTEFLPWQDAVDIMTQSHKRQLREQSYGTENAFVPWQDALDDGGCKNDSIPD